MEQGAVHCAPGGHRGPELGVRVSTQAEGVREKAQVAPAADQGERRARTGAGGGLLLPREQAGDEALEEGPPAVWPWVSHFTSLSLRFLIHQWEETACRDDDGSEGGLSPVAARPELDVSMLSMREGCGAFCGPPPHPPAFRQCPSLCVTAFQP